jgi:elongation factor Ts
MQIAAMNPIALDRDQIDQSVVEKEIEIGKEQARKEGKPEQIIEKIAQGKLQKFFKENTLLSQSFVKDNTLTIKRYLATFSPELSIESFIRISIG